MIRFAAPLVSGLLVGLTFRAEAFPGYTLLVALIPVLVFLGRHADDRRRVLGGFALYVAVVQVLLGYWVYALADYTVLAVPIFAGMAVWLGVFPMLFAAAARRVLSRTRWPLAVVVPPLWVAADLLRSTVPFGMRGTDLGYAAWKNPILVQTADLWGAFGVTYLIVLVNALAADAVLASDRRRALRSAVALALVVAAAGGYGARRMTATPVRRGPVIAVVQPNPTPSQRLSPARAAEVREKLARLTESASGAPVVIWPEAAVPGLWIEDPRTAPPNDPVRRHVEESARRSGAALLVGAVSVSRGGDGRRRFHNAAIAVNPAGAVTGLYRKSVLVPFAEGDPLPGWNPLSGPDDTGGLRLGGMTPGLEGPPLPLGPVRAGVMICYEQMFPGIARRQTLRGADLLVGLTNDSWFDRSYLPYWLSGTIALRAVENRRPVVRAALTGISLFVDPLGRVEARTEVRAEAVLVRPIVLGPPGTTLYARWGEVGAALAALAGVSLLLLAQKTRSPGRASG